MPNWTEHGISPELAKASQSVMESTKEKYNALVKKCAADMGIDMEKASSAEKKKLFNKVDQMWNSADEKGKDGAVEEEKDTCEPFDKKPMKESEEASEEAEEVIEEDTDLEMFDEDELTALEEKAKELGLKKKLDEEPEQLDELMRSPEEKIRAKNAKTVQANQRFWDDLTKAEKHFEKAIQMIQKSSRKNIGSRQQHAVIDERTKDLNMIWYMLKKETQDQMDATLRNLPDV